MDEVSLAEKLLSEHLKNQHVTAPFAKNLAKLVGIELGVKTHKKNYDNKSNALKFLDSNLSKLKELVENEKGFISWYIKNFGDLQQILVEISICKKIQEKWENIKTEFMDSSKIQDLKDNQSTLVQKIHKEGPDFLFEYESKGTQTKNENRSEPQIIPTSNFFSEEEEEFITYDP